MGEIHANKLPSADVCDPEAKQHIVHKRPASKGGARRGVRPPQQTLRPTLPPARTAPRADTRSMFSMVQSMSQSNPRSPWYVGVERSPLHPHERGSYNLHAVWRLVRDGDAKDTVAEAVDVRDLESCDMFNLVLLFWGRRLEGARSVQETTDSLAKHLVLLTVGGRDVSRLMDKVVKRAQDTLTWIRAASCDVSKRKEYAQDLLESLGILARIRLIQDETLSTVVRLYYERRHDTLMDAIPVVLDSEFEAGEPRLELVSAWAAFVAMFMDAYIVATLLGQNARNCMVCVGESHVGSVMHDLQQLYTWSVVQSLTSPRQCIAVSSDKSKVWKVFTIES